MNESCTSFSSVNVMKSSNLYKKGVGGYKVSEFHVPKQKVYCSQEYNKNSEKEKKIHNTKDGLLFGMPAMLCLSKFS